LKYLGIQTGLKKTKLIKFDFESDLRKAIQNEYAYLGVKINSSKSLDEMLTDYLTIHFKLVQPICRKVRVSTPLMEKLILHPKARAVQIIKQRLEKGLCVNLFQSKRLLQSDFHDHLLSEWHLYHFHLSTEVEYKERFFKKTIDLLFAYIDNSQAVLLDIEKHKDGIFADEKWLEILDDEFPEILEKYVDTEIKEIYPKLSSEERQALWDKGFSFGMTKVNGKVIHSPGIGRTTSGHSLNVSKTSMEIIRWIYSIKIQFSQYGEDICRLFGLSPHETQFIVQFGNPTLSVVDKRTKTKVLTFPNLFQQRKGNE
jgi:hypothetical protein